MLPVCSIIQGAKTLSASLWDFLILQRCDGHHIHAVLALVGIGGGAGQNHQKGGLFHFFRIDLISDRLQRMRTFLNEPVSTELDLYKAVASVAQVDNSVALLALFGAEMIHAAVQCFRVDAQIADAERFKE